jgi:hypothetical protein
MKVMERPTTCFLILSAFGCGGSTFALPTDDASPNDADAASNVGDASIARDDVETGSSPADAQEDAPPSACPPGSIQDEDCGRCGVRNRSCLANGTWAPWGACTRQGLCAAGTRETSTMTIRCQADEIAARTCSARCDWNAWTCECDRTRSLCNAAVLVVTLEKPEESVAWQAVIAAGGVPAGTKPAGIAVALGAERPPAIAVFDSMVPDDALASLTTFLARGGRAIYRGWPSDRLEPILGVQRVRLVSVGDRQCWDELPGEIVRTGPLDVFAFPRLVSGLRLRTERCGSSFLAGELSSIDGAPLGGARFVAGRSGESSFRNLIVSSRKGRVITQAFSYDRAWMQQSDRAYGDLLQNEMLFLVNQP